MPVVLVGLLGGGLLLPGAGRAGPCQTFGLGGQAMAMGGAVAAIAADYTATFYNPAGLAFQDRPTFGLGFFYGSPELRISGEKQDIAPFRAIQVGGSFPLASAGPLSRMKIGAVLHIPTATALTFSAEEASKPIFVLYATKPRRTAIYLCGAIRILPSLSFGGGASMFTSLTMDLNMNLRGEAFLTHYSPTEWTFSPIVGLRFQPSKVFSLAVVYRGEKAFTMEPRFRLYLEGVQVLPTVTIFNVSSYKPKEVVLAAMYKPGRRLLIGVDLTWMHYAAFEASAPHYVFEQEIPEWVKDFFSMKNPPDPHFHDILVPRFGMEYRIGPHFAFRAGYFYEPSPVPDQRGATNYVDSARHVFSTGGEVSFLAPWGLLKRPIILDVVFQAHVLEHRAVVKDDPADPVGNYTIDGEIFLGGIYLKRIF